MEEKGFHDNFIYMYIIKLQYCATWGASREYVDDIFTQDGYTIFISDIIDLPESCFCYDYHKWQSISKSVFRRGGDN